VSLIASARLRISRCDNKSARKTAGCRPVAAAATSFLAASARSASRQTITIALPWRANSRAVANPMPLLAPVMTTILSFIFGSFLRASYT